MKSKSSSTSFEEIDYSHKWYVMAAVGMGIFLGTIDGSIVNVALPTLTRSFNTDFPTVQWVVLAYLLAISTLMLSVGRLADMLGKKRIYNTGFVIFTIGSALCGLSPTVYTLVAFRVVQAIGAAMIMALGMAIVTEAFPRQERGRALGITGAIVSVGIVAGPTLGGLIINALSWRWIFYVNLPIGIIGTIMVHRYVPAVPPPGGQRFDFIGALTLFISLLSFLLALTLGQNMGFTNSSVLALFAGFFIFLIIFISVELRTEQPMIDLRLFKNFIFSTNLLTGFLVFIALAGTILLMPFFLENVLGFSPSQVGLLLAVVPISLGIVAPIAGSLSDRVGSRPITVVGLFLLLVGFIAVSSLSAETTAFGYILRFLPIGLGIGIFQSPNNSAIMGTAPPDRLGIVSGMLAVTRTLGQTTGIAILGAIWTSRVISFAGGPVAGGATQAAAASQVAGLQDTFKFVIILITFALALGIWALVRSKRQIQKESAAAPVQTSSMD
jgi:EmrB/QacA subfamily drug resistance transporter